MYRDNRLISLPAASGNRDMLLGLVLSEMAIWFKSVGENSERSIPLGRQCRINLFAMDGMDQPSRVGS